PEFFAQPTVIETGGRNQVTAQWDSYSRRYQNQSNNRERLPAWKKGIGYTIDLRPVKQRREVEAEIHDLNQHKQSASYKTGRKRHLQFWMYDGLGSSYWLGVSVKFRCELYLLHRGKEAIPAPGHGFHKPRTRSRVSQCFTQFVDGCVQAVVE